MKLLKKRFDKSWLFILGFTISIMGCNIGDIPDLDNTYLPDYKGNVAILLVKDTLMISKFLDEVITDSSALQEGNNQEIVFQYETQTDFTLGEDFVEINSFSNSEYLDSPLDPPAGSPSFVTATDNTIIFDEEVNFNLPAADGEEIDSLFYNSGTFMLELNSGFPSGVTVDYTFSTEAFQNQATNESISLSSTLQSQGGGPPFIDNTSQQLDGFKTLLQSEGDSNIFKVQIDAQVFIPAGTSLSGNEYLNFTLDVVDPEIETVFGFLGEDTVDIPTKRISLGLFNDFSGTGIEFEYPEISFTVDNSFGIPMSLDFSQAFAQYSDQDDAPISGEIADNYQTIESPSVDNYGATAQSTLSINSNNSNLRELLAASPDRLVLSLQGYSNLNSTEQNFVNDDSRIDIQAVISLPLSVRLDAFEYESDVEMSGLEDLKGTEELSLLFNTINELPFDGAIDLYFVNENGERFDSLKNNVLFRAPESYDPNGKVTAPSENSTEIELDAGKVESLTSAASLTLVTRLNSYEYDQDTFVKVFSDYELFTSVSIAGQLSVDLNGN